MDNHNIFEDLEVRTSSAQWAVEKARKIVNKNSLMADGLTQNVVRLERPMNLSSENPSHPEQDLWGKVKKMLLQ